MNGRWKYGMSLLALAALLAPGRSYGRQQKPTVPPANGEETAKPHDAAQPAAKTWVGKKAAGFTLPGIDGKEVDVAKVLGKKPVVLVFYRGVW